MHTNYITVAFTGASGAPYGLKLVASLLAAGKDVYLLISSAARVVLATENNIKIPANPSAASAFFQDYFDVEESRLTVFGKDEWFSPVASGSAAPKHMVICPCSTGTLSAVATGKSDNLIERAADVVIKERGQLIMVPREMPLSTIHLENMLKLSQMGVTMMPAAPGFYHNPTSIEDLVDFVVGRILDHLGIDQQLTSRWGYNQPEEKK
ncbi:UbiX family flavin prenyltransferase [Aestuariibacter sp. AA17]|uniref:Flavin prenyltransferase UbiX n=1 Tax=Fluctibacter corallii TaxID=2984329 RepID=A0ABT3AC84_9ALTE|nr:flavin prenyltransferase UbiX [Aestuariibacter sp. AA17]MCV2886243.1 UbiX family flavin prenyltransferase [Aestuariibacter sp. AA17]